MRFPFDWRNPIGYLIALSSQFIADTYFFIFVACVIAFGLGIFLFLLAAAKDIKTDLRLLNKCAKITKNQLRSLKRLSDFIEFHLRLNELSNCSNYRGVCRGRQEGIWFHYSKISSFFITVFSVRNVTLRRRIYTSFGEKRTILSTFYSSKDFSHQNKAEKILNIKKKFFQSYLWLKKFNPMFLVLF